MQKHQRLINWGFGQNAGEEGRGVVCWGGLGMPCCRRRRHARPLVPATARTRNRMRGRCSFALASARSLAWWRFLRNPGGDSRGEGLPSGSLGTLGMSTHTHTLEPIAILMAMPLLSQLLMPHLGRWPGAVGVTRGAGTGTPADLWSEGWHGKQGCMSGSQGIVRWNATCLWGWCGHLACSGTAQQSHAIQACGMLALHPRPWGPCRARMWQRPGQDCAAGPGMQAHHPPPNTCPTYHPGVSNPCGHPPWRQPTLFSPSSQMSVAGSARSRMHIPPCFRPWWRATIWWPWDRTGHGPCPRAWSGRRQT